MTVITSLAAGKFTVTRDGVVAFDTSALKKTFNLIPGSALSITGRTVTFPDLNTAVWVSSYYNYDGSRYSAGCTSYVGMLGQEWGPGAANNITDELLGTLPVKADYIDIKVKLTRTQAPTNYLASSTGVYPGAGIAWPQYLPDGKWVNLDGYSTLVEGLNNQVQRELEFVFDSGTGNISLRKRQSVYGTGTFTTFINTTSRTVYGFYGAAGQNSGIPAYCIDAKYVNGTILDPGQSYTPNGSNHCSESDPTNYTSIYSMDAVITPGRYSAA